MSTRLRIGLIGGFLAIILAVGVPGGFALEVPPAAKSAAVRSPDGVSLQVFEWGKADGPPIVFIHGSYQSGLSWMKQIADPTLAAKYRLVALDLRGHGYSDKPNQPEAYKESSRWAGDVATILDALQLVKPVLVGWSYGGRVINDYLMTYGDAKLGGLVYVDAVATMTGPVYVTSERRTRINQRVVSPDPATFVAGTREFIELCVAQPLAPDALDLLSSLSMLTPLYVRNHMGNRPAPYEAPLQAVKVPTHIVHGAQDAIIAPAMAEYTKRQIAHATYSLYPGSGHSPFVEDAARFNQELAAFMDKVK